MGWNDSIQHAQNHETQPPEHVDESIDELELYRKGRSGRGDDTEPQTDNSDSGETSPRGYEKGSRSIRSLSEFKDYRNKRDRVPDAGDGKKRSEKTVPVAAKKKAAGQSDQTDIETGKADPRLNRMTQMRLRKQTRHHREDHHS